MFGNSIVLEKKKKVLNSKHYISILKANILGRRQPWCVYNTVVNVLFSFGTVCAFCNIATDYTTATADKHTAPEMQKGVNVI